MSAVTAARPRSRGRAALGWIALAVGLLLVSLVGGLFVYGGYTERALLDPDSAGPDGTRAVVRVIEQQGVRVIVARDRPAAERALAGADATLVMRDAPMLSDDALRELSSRARHVVLVEPRSRALDVLMNGSSLGGFVDDTAAADCAVAAPDNARTARVGELLVAGDGVTGCFPVGSEFGLLSLEDGGRSVTALDGLSTLTNSTLPREGTRPSPSVCWGRPTPSSGTCPRPPTPTPAPLPRPSAT